MKKYHLTANQVAFIRLLHSTFAGIDFSINLASNPPAGCRKLKKKELVEALKETLAQADQALVSEYIRGELVKENILEDGGQELCVFDPSDDNTKHETEVYTQDDLIAIRANQEKPTWKNNVKGK